MTEIGTWAVFAVMFVLFMAVTVVPWALTVLVVSLFARGNTVYWLCVGWLTTAIAGALNDSTHHGPAPAEGRPRLVVTGLILFGGTEVKS